MCTISFILVFGPDLEQMRKLDLDFRERASRGDFEHEGRVAEQGAIADRRNEGVVGALDDFQPNGAAAEPRAEEILEVAHHRPEHVFEVILVVGRIFARATFRRGERRKLADQPQAIRRTGARDADSPMLR